jgi:DNA-binding transcriptional MocR family regulator
LAPVSELAIDLGRNPIYRSRRDALLTALGQHLPELEPAGIAAGLHLVAWLPQDLEETTVIRAAAGEGVAVAGVSPYRLSPAPRGGLIFGYSKSQRAGDHGRHHAPSPSRFKPA